VTVDPEHADQLTTVKWIHYAAAALGALFVLGMAFALKRRKHATTEGTIKDAS
jgi:hypothetical protein